MSSLSRLIRADFIKMKHTSFYWIHILVPLLGAIMFLSYYSFSSFDTTSKVEAYLQIVTIAFPMLIGIVCPIVVEQEALAGRFKEVLLSQYGREKTLISKVFILLFSGFIALVFAIGFFSLGFQYVLNQNMLPLRFYIGIILVIFGSGVFLYLFHIWLSFIIGSGASIGIGIFESLFAALLITGLGERVWQWIPCGWGARLCQYSFTDWIYRGELINQSSIVSEGVRNAIVGTVLLWIFLSIWFNFYEGRGER
ncbi:MAG: lantibiotic immunity ABC transporter MutG family permease subunit [Clostridiaceae bacterium]